MSPLQPPRWRLLAPVFAIVAIDAMGMGIILPLLPFYAERFGATPFTVGALMAIFSLCQFVTGPILGSWSDRIGRKPVLLVCMAGTAISLLLLAMASSLPLLFFARILGGLSAGSLSVASACAVDRSTPETRKQAIGIVSAAIGVGLIVGPSLSALSAHIMPSTPIWIAAVMAVVAMLTTQILLPAEDVHKLKSGYQKPARKSELLSTTAMAVMSLLSCSYIAIGMVMGGLALYLARHFSWAGHAFSTTEVGFIFTGTGMINIVVQLVLMKYVSQWFTDRQLIIGSFLLMGVGYAATGMVQASGWLALALAMAALGSSLLRPTLISLLSLSAPAGRQGMILGLNQSLMAMGNIAGPLIGGALLSNGLDNLWIAAITALYGTGAIATLFFYIRGLWPVSARESSVPGGKEVHQE